MARDEVAHAARDATRALARMARPTGDFDASRYFRNTGTLAFYNVGMPAVRQLARSIHEQHRGQWTVGDAMTFASVLVRHRYLEAKALAVEVVARHHREFTPGLLASWKRWLADGSANNWATTDAICGALIGPLLGRHPHLAARVAAWSRDRRLWVRRASAVGLISALDDPATLDLAYAVALQLRGDDEDLIHKAVGWTLREAGKRDARRLERFLRAEGRGLPRTAVRYAIERFPQARRRQLLDVTRARKPHAKRVI